jgi:predicted HAD superfamily hydrolase
MSYRAFSFDVFDTCLVRPFASPTDLFHELARQVLTDAWGEGTFGKEEIDELLHLRIEAEERAVQRRPNTATLAEIYAHLEALNAWNISPQRMLDIELDLELRSVRPVGAIRSQINSLRRSGYRILFLSDTYLPSATIQQMLIETGIAQPEEPVYVSAEVGLLKSTGELFDHVLKCEQLTPGEVHHTGDHAFSDYLVPRKRGISARLSTESRLGRFEQAVLEEPYCEPWVRAQVAGASRAARVMQAHEEKDSAWREIATIGASVVGPLLTAYVAWVLQHARRTGIERLYFVARDGRILLKVAEELASGKPDMPELRYLYGSRQAWWLPSVTSISREDLGFLFLHGQSSAPRHDLRRLNIDAEEVADVLERNGFPRERWDEQLHTEEEIERFWKVVQDPRAADRILANAAEARDVALHYFRQEGLLADSKWALVDSGWTLRTQGALRKILASAGQEYTRGYYLGLLRNRISARQYGQCHAFLLEDSPHFQRPGRYIFQNLPLIDQVFTMSEEGSTQGYRKLDGQIVPTLGAVTQSEHRTRFINVLHESTLVFAREISTSAVVEEKADELKRLACLTTRMLISTPTRAEATALAWATVSDDPNEMRSVNLAKRIGVAGLGKIGLDILKRLRQPSSGVAPGGRVLYRDLGWGFSWVEGSSAMSSPLARTAFWGLKAVQRMRSERETVLRSLITALDRRAIRPRKGVDEATPDRAVAEAR